MPKKATMTIEEIRTAVREVAESNRAMLAVLFGSYGRGTATQHSDIDVIFVEQTRDRYLDRLARYMYPLLDRLGPPVEVFVYTPDEFERMKQGAFVKRALEEGMVLYERGEA